MVYILTRLGYIDGKWQTIYGTYGSYGIWHRFETQQTSRFTEGCPVIFIYFLLWILSCFAPRRGGSTCPGIQCEMVLVAEIHRKKSRFLIKSIMFIHFPQIPFAIIGSNPRKSYVTWWWISTIYFDDFPVKIQIAGASSATLLFTLVQLVGVKRAICFFSKTTGPTHSFLNLNQSFSWLNHVKFKKNTIWVAQTPWKSVRHQNLNRVLIPGGGI